MNVDTEVLQQRLQQHLGWSQATLRELPGATSAVLYVAENGVDRAVVRIFNTERWAEDPADLTAREDTILRTLADSDLAAPRALTVLPGNGVVMSWLPGNVSLPQTPEVSWLTELATTLTRIHATGITVPFGYESWNNFDPQTCPVWWPDKQLWQQAVALHSAPVAAPVAFIHRDYHPLNLLWQDHQVSGIVDWINACMGPAHVDVSHCRLNLALMYGMTAADRFLDAYQQQNPKWRYQAYWDLDAAFGAAPNVEPYPPWTTFGLTGLTTTMMRQRLVALIKSVVTRHDRDGDS